MIIDRAWAMPNKDTFLINPISKLLDKYCLDNLVIIDPFSNGKRRTVKTITNDLDPELNADFHLDAIDFLRDCSSNSIDLVLFDPPYSTRQVSECYKKLKKTVNMQTTQSSYWGNMKKEISRIVKDGGKVITCGWNSGGRGKSNGVEINEVLIVAHGGWHNDTIVTVETKNNTCITKHKGLSLI